MVASKPDSRVATLPWSEKLIIAVLLCLEIPFGVVFFPMAAVFVLTGILAPLGMATFALATLPLSLAMKRRDAWHSRSELHHHEGDSK
jgi:hypothetical protein